MGACCKSCEMGHRCESQCAAHDSVGEDPLPPNGGGGIIQLINGVPVLVGVPGPKPSMAQLLPVDAIITPTLVGPYLLASTVLTGLPPNVPGAAEKASLSIPASMVNRGHYYVMSTIGAWKASPQGKSAGWQDPVADAYMAWLKKSYGTDDPVGVAVVDFLQKTNVGAGYPDWLTQQLAWLKQGPGATSSTKGTMGRTIYTEPKLGGYQDLQNGIYL